MSAGHIVLVGMMGSGKTTVGRQVAARLGLEFIDSDEVVERETGRTVRAIFEVEGEAAFRALEADVLANALESPERAVIAAAGGVVLDPESRARLRRAATVVWLRAHPDVLAARVNGADHRPLLGDDPSGVLRRLADERAALYDCVADAVVDVDALAPDEAVARVLELVA
jgi:shikimate kinase